MNSVPLPVLFAVPIIAFFFLFFLLPWMRREHDREEEARLERKRKRLG